MESSRDAVFGNVDLLSEILLRLLTKQVGQCKCVSKQWLALISSPRFCHSHALCKCKTSPLSFLWHQRWGYAEIVPFPHLSPASPKTYQFSNILPVNIHQTITRIVQSCNGFLLCQIKQYKDRYVYQMDYSYAILNPTTNHFLMLPPLPGKRNNYEATLAIYLAFEPLRSLHFKVISFTRDKSTDGCRFQIYVYSSEIGSWDEGGVLTTISPDFNVESGIYCNGAVHWYAPREASVYYDVDQQCLKDLPNPVSETGSYVYVRYFEEFKGNLYLGLGKNDESLDFDVLELKEDYSGWFLRYHVDLTHIGKCARPSFFVLYVACGENEEDPVIVLFCNWLKIVLYNPRDCTLRTMDEVDIKFYDIFAMGKIGRVLHPYFETLLNVGLEPYNG
ncbi:F-box-like domain superfamily [Sesbania bispinosa]|nr:F-box-like domain superfamily [Sesbania bispinosa]